MCRIIVMRNPYPSHCKPTLRLYITYHFTVPSPLLLLPYYLILSFMMANSPPHGSPSALHPDDSVSQTIPTFFGSDYQVGYHYSGENTSIPSEYALSSTPSGLLTSLLIGTSSHDNLSHQYSHIGPEQTSNYPGIPSPFLSKKKSRKGYCWLPANGKEFCVNGKWKWQSARCKKHYHFQYVLISIQASF